MMPFAGPPMITHVFRRCIRRCVSAVLMLALFAWWGLTEASAAPPFHGSLFTPVRDLTAIGPPCTEPVAYYPYEPRPLTAWTDVASEARETVAAHLKQRLGAEFYAGLKFVGGEAVNVAELHRVLPASRKFRQEVPTYLLWFEFERPAAGIRVYTASMAVRRNGSVIREIDLPPYATEPGKLKFAPLAGVTAGLIARGIIDADTTTVSIAYDEKHAQVLWHYEQVLSGSGPVVNVRNIDVNANTGAVLRRHTDHGGS